MDLSLNAGDLVGVVQDKDPMGNKDRWFVDNGGKKWPWGFYYQFSNIDWYAESYDGKFFFNHNAA